MSLLGPHLGAVSEQLALPVHVDIVAAFGVFEARLFAIGPVSLLVR